MPRCGPLLGRHIVRPRRAAEAKLSSQFQMGHLHRPGGLQPVLPTPINGEGVGPSFPACESTRPPALADAKRRPSPIFEWFLRRP